MLIITEELRDNLIKYLATRPYSEVAQGIAELSRLKKDDSAVLVPTEEPKEPKQ